MITVIHSILQATFEDFFLFIFSLIWTWELDMTGMKKVSSKRMARWRKKEGRWEGSVQPSMVTFVACNFHACLYGYMYAIDLASLPLIHYLSDEL